jgi:hypothetical protein
MTDVKLDLNGLNAAIRATILPDAQMRKLGFTDRSGNNWYLCSSVGADVTLNITIPKNGARLRLEVLDESFGQPYDYQQILKRNPSFEFALLVQARVEDLLEYLSNKGVISGFSRGMYI